MTRPFGSKNKFVNMHKRKWCPQGHDKDVVGRRPRGACQECANWANRVSRQDPSIGAKHKKYNREYWWKVSGILNEAGESFTVLDYDRHYQIQQGRCKCCARHQSEIGRALYVEHSHATGKFRGLVCQGCNIKIGAVESKDYAAVKIYLNGEPI